MLMAGANALAADPVVADIKTNKGTIRLELNAEKAPKSVENFVGYAKEGFYNGTIFHRVIKGFMVQGGGFTKEMKKKETKANIMNESNNGLANDKYTIAMARTNAPHTASSQFFINTNNNAQLNFRPPSGWGYAVFGKVVKGQEIVDSIENVQTLRNVPTSMGFPVNDVPAEPIVIESVTIVSEEE
ncbi:MAG: peptidylprolyl isomerase [Planctomycetota bacterium]